MKPTSVLATAALLALAVACTKKEPAPSETNITSAPVDRDRPVEITGGSMTTGDTTDPGNTQGGGASIGTTEGTNAGAIRGGRDAGIVDWPAVPVDRDRSVRAPSQTNTPTSEPAKPNAKGDPNNTSTPLGDGTSGTYTGGEGTYGGKATHGTGTPKDQKR
jgi:hypothetical protein